MSGFIRGVFSDNGAPSFSRVAAGFVVLMAGIWGTVIVLRTGTMPELGGLALFVGVLYGTNVGANAIKGRNGNGNGGTPNGEARPTV